MRKPEAESIVYANLEQKTVTIHGVHFKDIPALIKWLQKVQKYNEFKNKNKKKKVKNGSKSKRD